MAALMEVLEIKRIVLHLGKSISMVLMGAYLELNNKNNFFGYQYSVGTFPGSRNV